MRVRFKAICWGIALGIALIGSVSAAMIIAEIAALNGHDASLVFAGSRGEPLRADGIYKYHWLPTLKQLKLLGAPSGLSISGASTGNGWILWWW